MVFLKSYTKELVFNTKNKIEFVNITSIIEKIVEESKIKEGLFLVNSMHIKSRYS